MADKKKKTAGTAIPNGQKENNSTKIIAEPIGIVNMSTDEIVVAAIDRLDKEDKVKEFRERYQSYLTEVFENGKRTERKLRQSA